MAKSLKRRPCPYLEADTRPLANFRSTRISIGGSISFLERYADWSVRNGMAGVGSVFASGVWQHVVNHRAGPLSVIFVHATLSAPLKNCAASGAT